MPIPRYVVFDAPEAIKDIKTDDETLDGLVSDVIEALGQKNTAYSDLMNYAERVRHSTAVVRAFANEDEDNPPFLDDGIPELVMTMGRQLLEQFNHFGMYNLDGTLHHYYSGRIERSTIILTEC